MNDYLLPLLVFSPVIGMIMIWLMPKTEEKTLKQFGWIGTLMPLLISLFLYQQWLTGVSLSSYQIKWKWIQFGNLAMYDDTLYTVDFELSLDGFSLVFILLTTVLSMLAALASFYIKTEWKGYFLLFLLLEIGMLGVFMADNLLLFFLFFEVTFVSLFFLIGRWGYLNKEKAAYHFLVYNGIGSVLLLFVIATLFVRVGTTNIDALTHILNVGDVALLAPISPFLTDVLCILLFIAFAIKLPVFPFHSWMVRVHREAAPPVVMLHAGVLLKIGAYGMIRFGLGIFPEQVEKLALLFMIVGVISFLYGAFLALIQTDLKLVWAYSSVSHMGIVLFGFGTLNDAGLQGAVFQVVSHGAIAALLFFLIALLYERTGTTELNELGGLAAHMPIFSGVLLTAGLAALGLPGMSGFISEFMAFLGLFKEQMLLAIIAVIGLILTAAYTLRAVLKITFGKKTYSVTWRDVQGIEYVPIIILFTVIVAIGVYPMWLGQLVQEDITTWLLRIGG
ncbi:NuoM family protein [Peribacillus sp. Hz7]|uniref:complex I subunit 4 family protein n=1 Tax=Peribacillus sp. Hz7 TaxID=3344873 RepID=UPI0035CAB158